jgi:hypoxanthine phosphoribosyltransferase
MTASPEPELFYLPYDEFLADVRKVAERIAADAWQPDYVVGIGRGGLVPAVYISHQLNTPMLSVDHSSKVPGFAEELLRKVAMRSASGVKLLFVDDINDSGRTIATIVVS